MAEKTSGRARRDRWADWAVVGVLIVALLLGWAVMALAEGMSDVYTNSDSAFTVRYPQDWLLKKDDRVAFRAVDPSGGEFKTTYEIRVMPIDPGEAVTPALSVVLNNVALERASQTTAHRLFGIAEGDGLDGKPTMESSYVYVQKGSDLFLQRMPAVVLGRDIAVAEGNRAYVFTLLAEKDAFEDAERAFRRFVRSAETW